MREKKLLEEQKALCKESSSCALCERGYLICNAKKSGNVMKWKIAMQEEYKFVIDNTTWELIPLPPNHSLIGCKQVFQNQNICYPPYCKIKGKIGW